MAISRIFADKGEEAFRKLETQCLEKLLKTTDGAVISVGGGLPFKRGKQRAFKEAWTGGISGCFTGDCLQAYRGRCVQPSYASQ